MQDTTKTYIYLFNFCVTVVTNQHQGNVYQSRNMCFQQRQVIFIALDLVCVTRNEKAMYFTEAMKLLALRPQHFVIWAQASVYKKVYYSQVIQSPP